MHVYGPVPSRRFGLSLGVDLVPRKSCPFDCLYCQLGPTDRLLAEPSDFYPVDAVLREVEQALSEHPRPDVITLAGSGEPTLFRSLGLLIDRLKALSDLPVLLITNSALFWRDEVAAAVAKADILAPSLDAGTEERFALINRPHPEITYDRLLSGLKAVTRAHPGAVHLEVMLVKELNDDPGQLEALAGRVAELRFDRIDVNTPVRPPVPERGAMPCDRETLDRARKLFGPKAFLIGGFERHPEEQPPRARSFSDQDKDVRELLLRRPCTAGDIAACLALPLGAVNDSLRRLEAAGLAELGPGGYFRAC